MYDTLKSMKNDKIPGNDGLSKQIYRSKIDFKNISNMIERHIT